MFEGAGAIIPLILCGMLMVSVIVYGLKDVVIAIKKRKEQAAQEGNEVEHDEEFEPELTEIHAVIEKMTCGVDATGFKTVNVYKEFTVSFRKDDGELLELPVEEEFYLALEEGMVGTVAIVNDRFYGFCPDDEQTEE